MPMKIVTAQSGQPLDHFIKLADEYVTWMLGEIPQHYPDMNLNEFASEHAYDDIRKKFPGEHTPPDGGLLVAMQEGRAAGCIAFGRLSDSICEVRTLFVQPAFRGAGAGRKLVEACLQNARDLGYDRARLDTLSFMTGAQRLYTSFGFYPIDPYLDVSERLRRHIRFFECQLYDEVQG